MEEEEYHPMADNSPQHIAKTVKEYGKKLFNFIRNKVNTDEDAEDILQDVWYQYSSSATKTKIERVSSWLFTVARNKVTDKYRKQQPERIDDFVFEEDDGETYLNEILFSVDDAPEIVHLRNLFWEELWNALDELPQNQKTVFVRNELEDRTLQEIADETGENIKTIISRKRYAVQHLRLRLRYLYDDLLNY